jgi:hypothetical protein
MDSNAASKADINKRVFIRLSPCGYKKQKGGPLAKVRRL